MDDGDGRKYGNLTLFRGGNRAPRQASPRELLDREVREGAANLRGKDGKVVSRACYEIAEDKQHPHRYLAKRLDEAADAGAPAHHIWNTYLAPLIRYYDRKHGTHLTGEFRMPAA